MTAYFYFYFLILCAVVNHLKFSNVINPQSYCYYFASNSYISFKDVNVRKMSFRFICCYGLNVCVPPKFICVGGLGWKCYKIGLWWSLQKKKFICVNSECDGIRSQRLYHMIGHEAWALVNAL